MYVGLQAAAGNCYPIVDRVQTNTIMYVCSYFILLITPKTTGVKERRSTYVDNDVFCISLIAADAAE